jgi:carboxyl-terminal processing protease
VLPGDRIIEIDGRTASRMTVEKAAKALRGRPGTEVTLKLVAPGRPVPRTVTVVRRKISAPSVWVAALSPKIGYVRLSTFNDDTAQDFSEAVEKLVDNGTRSIVLDLRNNGGGLLNSAVEICDLILSEGVIVSTSGRTASDNQKWYAKKRGTFPRLGIVVLVNGGSASASEIVAGAIQDHKRGPVVGTNTFGKGTVQTIIPLSDGSAIKLTTARYLTPSGRTFTRESDSAQGVVPDHEVALTPEQQVAVGSLLASSRPDPPSDPQLKKALELLKGR